MVFCYTLSSIWHVFFLLYELTSWCIYLLLIITIVFPSPRFTRWQSLPFFWLVVCHPWSLSLATWSLLLSFLLFTETDCKFRMASTQPWKKLIHFLQEFLWKAWSVECARTCHTGVKSIYLWKYFKCNIWLLQYFIIHFSKRHVLNSTFLALYFLLCGLLELNTWYTSNFSFFPHPSVPLLASRWMWLLE